MIDTKIILKRKAVIPKIEITTLKEIQIQNRKTFFENALADLSGNPFRIVML